MQQVKLVIVCRFNQARSIVVAAMLRKFFPDLQITTCGVEGEDGKPIPIISADLCESWGLKEYDRISRSLSALEECSSQDLILAADDWVYEQIRLHFPHLSTSNLLSYAADAQLAPMDPTGLDPRDFSEEIAKACVLSLRWLEDVLNLPSSDIEAHVFHSQKSLDEFMKNPTLHVSGVRTFIDTDFAYPDIHLWKRLFVNVLSFHPRLLHDVEVIRTHSDSPTLLVSRFELDVPSQLFMTVQWRQFLHSIASEKPIALICRNFAHGPRSVTGALLTMNAATTVLHA